MNSESSGQDRNDLEDPRITALNKRLREVQKAEKVRTEQAPIGIGLTGKGSSQGNRVLSVLIGFPFGSALIGWLFDRLFKTSPAIMLVMLFLGFGAAIYQVYRISKERAE
jgi:ATP synthase protein I